VVVRAVADQSLRVATQALFRDDAYLRECDALVARISDDGVELDRTVFYPHGGGQAGDTGFLTTVDGAQLRVIDARKVRRDDATPDDVLHVVDPSTDWQAQLKVGTPVRAQIDWDRRYRHMRFHTATHLLCAVVKQLVDGCSITSDYARLDFAMTDPLDKLQVQQELDALIAAGRPVVCKWISDEELRVNPQLVKSMSVSPPLGFGRVRLLHVEDVDLQPCGGTHVRNTAEIGGIRVAKIEKKSARTRRVVLEFT
jgi:misacylated tRNA(Ala) deacylase